MADLSSSLFQQLAGLISSSPVSSRKTDDLDIAQYLLANSSVDFSQAWKKSNLGGLGQASIKASGKHGGPSNFSRVIDVLSRPIYATWEGAKRSQGLSQSLNPVGAARYAIEKLEGGHKNPQEELKGAVSGTLSGLSGKSKTLPSTILAENNQLPENKWGRFGVGLTADILGDPLSYVGPGVIKGGVRAVRELTGAQKAVSVLPPVKAEQLVEAVSKGDQLADKLVAPKVDIPKAPTPVAENITRHTDTIIKGMRTITPIQQIRLFNSMKGIGEAASGSTNALKSAYLMMKEAEQHLLNIGRNPQWWDGTNLNITDLIDEMGGIDKVNVPELFKAVDSKKKTLPQDVFEAVERLRARSAIEDAPKVSIATEQTLREAGVAEHALSPMQASMSNEESINNARNVLSSLEASDSSRKTFGYIVRDSLKASRGSAQNVFQAHADTIEAVVRGPGARGTGGRFIRRSSPTFPKVIQATTNAINGSLDEPIRVLKPGETVSEKGVVHGIMARVATWWGQKDIRPLALDATTSALASAQRRVDALTNVFKGHSEQEVLNAWNIATKRRPTTLSSPKEVELADQITGAMETWFKSSAVSPSAMRGNSVALRAGFTREDINKALSRYGIDFKFTNGSDVAVKNGQVTRDFSKDVDWLDSWEASAFEKGLDVKKFMFAIQSAGEQLSREYGFVDDVAARFGSTKYAPGLVKVQHSRLGGYYFPTEMADQLSLALNNMHDFYRPDSPVMKLFASATSAWKSGVTKYHPRHHIANIIGDTYLAWVAGMNNPRMFTKAMRVMESQKGLYNDLESVEDLVGMGAVENSLSRPGNIILKTKGGLKLTNEQVYIAAHNYGLLQKASAIEDIMRPGLGKIKPFGGKVSQAASKVSETREHFVKLAHFMDEVSKSKSTNPREAFEAAAHTVRKWHPDGLDLTKAEQKARMAIPFYSWSRKSIPLLVEGAVMNPKKAFVIPQRFQYHAQLAMGIQPSSPSDPFPADQLFPKWIQESGVGPMGKQGAGGLSGFIGSLGREGVGVVPGIPGATPETTTNIPGYVIAGPTTPMQDLFNQFGGLTGKGIVGGALSSVNPAVRIPLELQSGKRFFSDVPIDDKSDYATEQIPFIAQLSRMTNMSPFGATKRGQKEGTGFQSEGTINWLTGANIRGTGPYINSVKFEDIPRNTAQNKQYREFARDIGYPLNSKGKIPQWIKDLYNQQNQGG